MRDKLIHGYFGVDIDAVWNTIQRDIPILKKHVEILLENAKRNDSNFFFKKLYGSWTVKV